MSDDLERAQRVREAVARVAHTIDARRWAELRALFADEVETDYTSLFGGQVQRQGGDVLIETWRKLLSPLRATQHLLGPVEVRLEGPRARAECHVRGYHYLEGLPGGPEWMVAGHYLFELVEAAGQWRIAKMTLQAYYQTGNRNLLQEAAQRS
jgi:hypothetical protein